jgi:predicted dehydrogenase
MIFRFGIVGCGYIGNRHAKYITEHPESTLVAAYDVDEAAATSLCNTYKISQSRSLHELINNPDIDIISICTPNGNHYDSALSALEAGKNVIIEKPMALKREHAEKLINVALSNTKQIFVVKQNRFNPPVQALKQLIDEGKLGKIFYVVINCYWNRNKEYYKRSVWKGKKDLDGGTLFTQFSHFVDISYYLFGDVENISGIIKNVCHDGLIEFEDTGAFTYSYMNGALGSLNYTTASYQQNMEGSITVFAENATIKIGGKYLNALEYQKTNEFDITDLPESGPANEYGFYQGSMSNHDKMIANVIDALNGRGKIMTNAIDGMKVVDIIERMYKAAKQL